MSNWDERWMSMCDLIASWSKDRSRKTGAVIVDDRNTLISLGWNGFPRGINDDVEKRHQRPEKYAWSEHAERNAIYNAPRSIRGATMYLPWFPCSDCARAIIQSGIGELVCIEPDWNSPTYGDDFRIANEMLCESSVKVRCIGTRKAPEYVQ